MPSYSPNPGTVRVDVIQHTGLVATQSAAGDIAQIVGDLGGNSAVLAFYDARIASSITGTNPVTQVIDARGGSYGYTLTNFGSGNIIYDNVNDVLEFNDNFLSSASISGLDPTVSPYTWVAIWANEPNNSSSQSIFQSYQSGIGPGGTSTGIGIITSAGAQSSAFQFYIPGPGSESPSGDFLPSTQMRMAYLTKTTGTGATVNAAVLDEASISPVSTTFTAGNAALVIGNNQGSNSSNVFRAAILMNTVITAAQLNFLRQWAIAKHFINLF